MKRLAYVFGLIGVLLLLLLSSSYATWAAPLMDPLRQTVPTRTPTSPARTPGPPTATRQAPDEDTPTPYPPTATLAVETTATVAPTSAPSDTPVTPATVSDTATPTTSPVRRAWDFGDAPDPGFPSLEASDGARHSILSFEWLGRAVDGEMDSRQIDGDLYDDGVVYDEFGVCTQATVQVRVTVGSREDLEHLYDAQHLLYLNVLVDWDGDGSWSGRVYCPEGLVASEWAVRNLPIDVSSWPEDTLSAAVPVEFPVGPLTGQVWARFTLSYGEVISGEEWDGSGAFTYGETEDYLVTVSLPPPVPPEEPSPTSLIAATPQASATPAAGVLAGPESWRSLACLGAVLLLAVAALLLVLVVLRGRGRRALAALLLIIGVVAVATFALAGSDLNLLGLVVGLGSPTAFPTPRERLIPTVTATKEPTAAPSVAATDDSATPSSVPTATPSSQPAEPSPEGPESVVATPLPSLISVRERFGFGVAISSVEQFNTGQLHAGWYLTWSSDAAPSRPQGMEFAQMIRIRDGQASPSGRELERIAQSNPGSLWIVGNEPDVPWQDDVPPDDYARVYHDVYTSLKSADPTCQVAIGGVSQATPLRLSYLDTILEAYEDLYGQMIPVDVWNVHAFVLREERGSWGVDIPAGMSVDEGRLFELEDHEDVGIFREQIVAFRRWMKDRGERNKPLIVSEYGILMPADYGFPYESVRDFMYASFDFFMTATDPELGYPADGNRLVQRWAWYSLSDTVYPSGNLFDPVTGQITPLGLAYGSYASSH